MNTLLGKRIMIVGAGTLQVPAIVAAKEMGLETVVIDYNPSAEGMLLADCPVVASTRDIEGAVRVARQLNEKARIHGVITVGTDASATVAAVANALELPGIRYEDAIAATNKIRMRERLNEYGVRQPAFRPVWTLAEALEGFRALKKPAVLKPADNMGARGVMKIECENDVPHAFKRAKDASPSGQLIIEEYMEGKELSIDMLIYDGVIHVTGVADRIIEYAPFFVETGHLLPSGLPQANIDDAIDVMKQGIRALNLTIGAAKGDIKITSEGAKVGEIAARLSGGFMSGFTYPYASGVPLTRNALEIALGYPPSSLTPTHTVVAMEKAIIAPEGYVTAIEGVREAKEIPGVKNVFLRAKEGDRILPPTNNLEKAGNVIVVAETREEAVRIAEEAVQTITIITERSPKAVLPKDEEEQAIEALNE